MSKNTTTRVLIVCYLAIITLYINFPNTFNKIRCPFYALTHLPCAGCGATRAIKSLYEGKVSDSLRYNALAVISLPLLIISLLSNKFINLFESRLLSTLPIFIILGFFILRLTDNILHINIPLIGFKN